MRGSDFQEKSEAEPLKLQVNAEVAESNARVECKAEPLNLQVNAGSDASYLVTIYS